LVQAPERDAEPQPAEPQPVEPQTGLELMFSSLETLNSEDPNGIWSEDPFNNPSPLVVGVILDRYSEYPDGCAAYWFNSESDSEKVMDDGVGINFFSDFYGWWVFDSGPSLIVVANSEYDACYQNITRILELEIETTS
jgi:hypothetical protein